MNTKRVRLRDAELGMRLADPIYVRVNAGGPATLLAKEGAELDENIIRKLEKHDVKSFNILVENPSDSNSELLPTNRGTAPGKPPEADFPQENIDPIKPIISDKLKEKAVGSIHQLFTSLSGGQGVVIDKITAHKCVSDIEQVVSDLIDVLSDDATGLVHINDLKSFDEYTYQHSISVTMLSMATGRELGLHHDDIFRLGRSAMMHDIGKQMVPLEIINKAGKLTDEEFILIKSHSTLGANTLESNEMGDSELWNAVKHHHEKMNGTGYPDGLNGSEIPLFSKIISVADVYDAVTSYRSYREPMPPWKAFEVIRKGIGSEFDYNVVQAFFERLEIYPINSIVELSDGRYGVVVEGDNRFRLRPAVRIKDTSEVLYLAAPENMAIQIVGVRNPGESPQ